MTALQQAKAMHEKAGLDFEKVLCWYLANGYVINYPDKFVMAKKIVAADGSDCWNPEHPDCWFVWCAVGKDSLKWVGALRDEPLPLIAFTRFEDKSQRLRVYNSANINRILKYGFI